jgi:putative acetyltransferase
MSGRHRTIGTLTVRAVTGNPFRLRDAAPSDADRLTALYLRSRTVGMPWLISPHDDAETRLWVERVLLVEHRVRLVHEGNRVLGFAAVDGSWLEQLFVDPDHQGRGVGRALLDDAKRASPGGLSLHVFTRNGRARRFYTAAGFVLSAQSDGKRNEEREPDCTYVWSPRNR